MCEIATDQTSNWLMVDPWEAVQPDYMPTALVLDHFEREINEVLGGVETQEGGRKPVQISLLAGADLIQTMSSPGVWSDKDLNHILGRYGTFIVERTGTDIDDALSNLQQCKSKFLWNIFYSSYEWNKRKNCRNLSIYSLENMSTLDELLLVQKIN